MVVDVALSGKGEPVRKVPFPHTTMIVAEVLLVINVGGAYLLDALGLVEGLLSPSGGRLFYLLPLCVLFFVTRILALFVAPGLALGTLLWWMWERQERRTG